jgi:hypothetical protein
MFDTLVRPVEGYGVAPIDLSEADVDKIVFNATGGGYGGVPPSQPQVEEGATPSVDPGANTNFGDPVDPPRGDGVDDADPGTIVDPHRDIMLTTDMVVKNPLHDIMAPHFEEPSPTFESGGPEGVAVLGPVVVGLLILAAIYLSGGCDGKKGAEKPEKAEMPKWEDTHYSDPDAAGAQDAVPSPKAMLETLFGGTDDDSLFKAPGGEGVKIGDPAATLFDRIGDLTSLVGRLKGGYGGSTEAAAPGALLDELGLAGFDDVIAFLPGSTALDQALEAAGWDGGFSGGVGAFDTFATQRWDEDRSNADLLRSMIDKGLLLEG